MLTHALNRKPFSKYILSWFVILLICAGVSYSFAASGTVDPTFNPLLTGESTSINAIALQQDGKIIVGGSFIMANGISRNNIVRLNADGSLDSSFMNGLSGIEGGVVNAIIVQPDGKVLVGGAFGTVNGLFRHHFVRLNSDGSVDNDFLGRVTGEVRAIALQPDGKIIIGGSFTNVNIDTRNNIARVNSDGSTDNTFNANVTGTVYSIDLQPDGKVFIGGSFFQVNETARTHVAKLNSDGSLDNSFPNLSFPVPGNVKAVKTQADGKVLIGGDFASVNSISRNCIARLNSDGTVDGSFNAGSNARTVSSIVLQADGKIIVGIINPSGFVSKGVVRLNTDGSVDASFLSGMSGADANVNAVALQQDGKFFIGGNFRNFNNTERTNLARLNSDGSLDDTLPNVLFGNFGYVTKSKRLQNGKLLVFGSFSYVGNTRRNGFARLNADGTLDTSFSANVSARISAIAEQPDGKIIIGGNITSVNDTPRLHIARLNLDGSLDTSFSCNVFSLNASLIAVRTIIIQADGKIIIGGYFNAINDISIFRPNIARLNNDGSVDNSFPSSVNGAVNVIVPQSDGKFVVGGEFSSVSNIERNKIARLNANGTLDTSFQNGMTGVTGTTTYIKTLAIQPNGKVVIGGYFFSLNGATRNNIARLNSDGSLDNSFTTDVIGVAGSITPYVYALAIQPDGKIIIGGNFSLINGIPKRDFARLKDDGNFDTSFAAEISIAFFGTSTITDIDILPDNNILVAGGFASINNTQRTGLARLINVNTPPRTNFDFDGDGKADVAVFRPSTNVWYTLQSSNFQVTQQTFGLSSDIVTPADFDGDGKTDLGIFRPSTGTWWYKSSLDGTQRAMQWGANGDIPLPSDFNGDGKADFVLYRPSNNTYYRLPNDISGIGSSIKFGLPGDIPLIGDFNGDGKTDPAIFRPSTGDWWWQSSVDNVQRATHWGIATDKCVPADYDGDGKTDFAVYRQSTGVWYIRQSSDGSATILQFGISEDRPVAADYDGDGKADIAVFRPSTGVWYLLRSSSGFAAYVWGVSTDVAIPNAFIQ